MRGAQGDLFGAGTPPAPVTLHRPGVGDSAGLRDSLMAELPLAQHQANMGGRLIPVPRLEAWIGEPGTPSYRFGGRSYDPQPWTPWAHVLRERVEHLAGERFPACFVNVYRGPADHIPWHADNEPWIGPVIASLSLGDARRFQLRHKASREVVWDDALGAGDLIVMGAGCQQDYEHRAPKGRVSGVRVVCAWCPGKQTYLGHKPGPDGGDSHGICPACRSRVQEGPAGAWRYQRINLTFRQLR